MNFKNKIKLDDDDDLNEKNANQDRGNVFVRQILTKSKDQIDKKMSLIPHQLDLNSYLDEKKECNTEETPKSIFYTKQITQSQNIAKEEKKQKISKQIWKQNHFNNEKAKKNIENDTLSTKQNEIAMTFSQSIKTEIPLITDQCFNHLKSGNSQLPYEKKLKSEEYQAERLKVFQDQNNLMKVREILFNQKFFYQFQKPKNEIQDKIKCEIEQEVNRSLNIFEQYKDLIFMKKAIMMLLTQEQLSAIKFLGCSPPSIQNLDQEKKDDEFKQSEKNSYLQRQIDVYSSIELQSQYLQNYIYKCQKSDILCDLDKRIISSFFKT